MTPWPTFPYDRDRFPIQRIIKMEYSDHVSWIYDSEYDLYSEHSVNVDDRITARPKIQTRGPRWPWIAHLVFWDCSCQFFFFFVAFREEFTRISLCLYSARSLHSLIPCLLTDQNFKNNSEKGQSRNISIRLFQNLTKSFREHFLWFCLCFYSQVAPIHQSFVLRQIKAFERSHFRNISVNWELEATYSVVLIE